jgi:RNA polymerase sigma-70 factor (sigma-E family)
MLVGEAGTAVGQPGRPARRDETDEGRRATVDPTTRATFDEFARSRMPALLRFAHALSGDPHTAADLVQDALERTVLAWPRVTRQDDPEAYVRRAIVNRHISRWRRLRREQLTAAVPETTYVPTAPRDDQLWSALTSLPPRQRAVIVLRYYEDLSEAQTAQTLGCSVGTVKSQASEALAKLRLQVRPAEQESETTTWTA